MRFVVTGGAGFIGNNIVRHLIKNKHSVIVIDNLHTGNKENLKDVINEIEFYDYDIRDYEKIKSVLKNIDGVFHEAALTIVQESFTKKQEYFDVNVKGTENILKIAKENGFKVVYASSSSIYGNVSKIPIKETFEKKPINPYGETKLKDEELAIKYSDKGVKVIGLRYFNVYGIGQTGSYAGVITKFMNRILEGKPPVINGGGKQTRDFVFVEDVADANLCAMKSKTNSGFFNIGTGKIVSIKQLAELMISIYEKSLTPEFGPSLKGDVMQSQADTSLAEKMLSWRYKTELKDGLSSTIKL